MSTQMGGFPFAPGAGAGSGQMPMGGAGGTMYSQEGGGWQGAAGYGGQQFFGQAPQQGGPPQPHPTVPYGQGIPNSTGWGQQPPQQGWGQQGAPAPQQQPPFNSRMVQLTDDTILDGPGVPQHLRGRSFGFLRQLYDGLSNHYMQTRNGGGEQPQAQAPTGWQQGGQGQAAGGANGGAAPGSMGTASFLANPTEAIRRVVREEIQPLQGTTMQQAIQETWRQAPSAIPDYALIEQGIIQRVAQLTPDQRANLQAWLNAADMARGEAMRTGEYDRLARMMRQQRPNGQQQGNGQGQQQPGGRAWVPAQGGPVGFGGAGAGGWAPAGSYPYAVQAPSALANGGQFANGWAPGGMSFFSELPTSPAMHEFASGALTPEQLEAARGFGMTPERYIAWYPNRG